MIDTSTPGAAISKAAITIASSAKPAAPAQTWKDIFVWWPAGIPRRGVLVNSLNEAMPFKGFMIKDEMLLLERTNPDPIGARYILLGFDTISSVKFVDPLKESVFANAGFVGKLST